MDETKSNPTSVRSWASVLSDSPRADDDDYTHYGWLDKFSVGKSVASLKNWRKRYFASNLHRLTYYTDDLADTKPSGQIVWRTVTRVVEVADISHHPEAKCATDFYFLIHFVMHGIPFKMLLRAPTVDVRRRWCAYIHHLRLALQDIGDTIPTYPLVPPNLQERFQRVLRSLVSLEKQRFTDDGVDLDLSYVLPNVIAMGFPSVGREAVYRNPLPQVEAFLTQYHPSTFRVFNLCSERYYGGDCFDGGFRRYPFDDHNPCPLEMLVTMCVDLHAFLRWDTLKFLIRPSDVLDLPSTAFQRTAHPVAAIHCKAGKGRTGLVIAAYMVFARVVASAQEALRIYSERRTRDGKGVQIPSQVRYVHYLDALVNKGVPCAVPSPRGVRIASLTLSYTPRMELRDSGCTPFIVVQFRGGNSKHQPQGTTEGVMPADLACIFSSESVAAHVPPRSNVKLPIDIEMTNVPDFRIVVYSKAVLGSPVLLLSFWAHTAMLPDTGMLTLSKVELDTALKDTRHRIFPHDFTVSLNFTFLEATMPTVIREEDI